MELLISLLIILVIGAVVYWLITLLPLPPVARQVALVIFVLVLLLWLLRTAGLL